MSPVSLLFTLSLLGMAAAMGGFNSPRNYGYNRRPSSGYRSTYATSNGRGYSTAESEALERVLARIENSGHTEQGRQNKMKRLTDSVNFNLDIANTIRAQQTLEEENDQQDKRLAGIAAKIQIIKDIKATIDWLTSEAADRTAEIEAIQDTRRQIRDEINQLNDIDDSINDRLATLLASAIEVSQRVNRLNEEIADNKRGINELSLLVNQATRASNAQRFASGSLILEQGSSSGSVTYDLPFLGVPQSFVGIHTFMQVFTPSDDAVHPESIFGQAFMDKRTDAIDLSARDRSTGRWSWTKIGVDVGSLYFYKLHLRCPKH